MPKQPKNESLYELDLPGKVVVKFYKTTELTPARRRELEVYTTYMLPLLQSLQVASSVTVDGQTVDPRDDLPGLPVGLTRDQTRELLEMNDVAALTYLKSWNVRETIKDPASGNTTTRTRPLPTNVDELKNLPATLFDPIWQRASKLVFAEEPGFTVDSVEDEESPTGP